MAVLLCLAGAGGCDDGGSSGVGGVTPGEARALNEAAEMLDSRQAPPEAPVMNGNGY